MRVLEGCRPEKVFEIFELLCSVPHGSGNTKQISDICAAYARERGLTVRQDEYNNLVIVKEASPGCEAAPGVILQGHMDMVCASEPSCGIDMAVQGLKLQLDGDWISAEGTSLGGDDCIGVAIIMALLTDDSLRHPRLEAIFTTDEETGMDGAIGLDMSDIRGRVLVNLDSEEEGFLTAGCSGGVRADCSAKAELKSLPQSYVYRRANINGLMGGHSGVDIDKGRASAIKLMGRFLHRASLDMDIRLRSAEGGSFTNVIAPTCTALIALPEDAAEEFDKLAAQFDDIFKAEYAAGDPDVCLSCAPAQGDYLAFSREDSARMLALLLLIPFGVEEMSMDIPGLVQTSANPGVLAVGEGGMELLCSLRSSMSSQKDMLEQRVSVLCGALGAELRLHSAYPGWEFRRESPLRDAMAAACEKVLGKTPIVTATHGGLECGLFMEKLSGLDCVSLGPELKEVHSVRERLSVRSTENLYSIMADFLESWR